MNPMPSADAEWIRAHVWPDELVADDYRTEPLCSCQWPCDCATGRHQYCITPGGIPATDVRVAIVYGSRHTAFGFGRLLHRRHLADVICLPWQTPCRLLCQCTHDRPAAPVQAPEQTAPTSAPARRLRPVPVPAGQLGLFEEATT